MKPNKVFIWKFLTFLTALPIFTFILFTIFSEKYDVLTKVLIIFLVIFLSQLTILITLWTYSEEKIKRLRNALSHFSSE